MKRYDTFQDCPTPWLAQVPSHWRKLRYKDVMRPKDIKVGDNPVTLLSLTKKGVIVRDISEGKGKFPSDFSSYKIVEPNDLIMCLFDVDETPRTVGIAHASGMITGAYDIFNVAHVSRDFLLYHFLHIDDKKAFKPLYKGLRKVVPLPSLLSSYVYLPPTLEQEAIVAFLDSKTSKIDSYVAERERELHSLEELKQAEIASVVTRGLNPNVPMRDSGIPWLGQIPAHWKIDRAKNIFYRVSRPVKEDDEVITCFRDGQVTLRKNRRTEGFTESFKEIGYQGIRKGDLVIHQMDAFAGAIGVSDADGKGTPVYICCLPKIEANNWFYSFILREMARTGYIKSLYRGIRERSSDFRFETFAIQYLPIPPIEEQQAIVDYINAKTAKIDGLIADLSAQIEKLKEYKQRLISDAVTGQIDVSDYKPSTSAQ